ISARARVMAPSSARGQRACNCSATNRFSSASPRNSRRSLCGLPALRWVRAWPSSAGSAKRWPPKLSGAAGIASVGAAVGELPRGVELADDVQVADQRLAHLVGHRHLPAAADALDLDVVGLHVL